MKATVLNTLKAAAAVLAAVAAMACGNEQKSEDGPFAKNKRGGYIRMINLTENRATLNFGPRQFFVADPSVATSFALYRPGLHDSEIRFDGAGTPLTPALEVKPEQTLSIYLAGASQDGVILIPDDPRSAKASKVNVRLVNLTGKPVKARGKGVDFASEDRGASETREIEPGPATLTFESNEIPPVDFDGAAGRAYTVLLYGSGNKVKALVIEAGAPMQTAEGGASASG